MQFRNVGSRGKLDADCWGYLGFPVILRKPLSNLGRSHTHDSVVRGVVISAPAKHFYADRALMQVVHITRQGVFYHEPEKLLAAFASGESITRNHRFERTANGLYLFRAESVRVFELMSCCHKPLAPT